jgi:hypothetical protein
LRNAAIRLRGNDTVIELNNDNAIDAWINTRLSKAKKEVLRNLDVKIIAV